jgi:hypothetical protein
VSVRPARASDGPNLLPHRLTPPAGDAGRACSYAVPPPGRDDRDRRRCSGPRPTWPLAPSSARHAPPPAAPVGSRPYPHRARPRRHHAGAASAAGPLPHLPGQPRAASRGGHPAPRRHDRGHRVGVGFEHLQPGRAVRVAGPAAVAVRGAPGQPSPRGSGTPSRAGSPASISLPAARARAAQPTRSAAGNGGEPRGTARTSAWTLPSISDSTGWTATRPEPLRSCAEQARPTRPSRSSGVRRPAAIKTGFRSIDLGMTLPIAALVRRARTYRPGRAVICASQTTIRRACRPAASSTASSFPTSRARPPSAWTKGRLRPFGSRGAPQQERWRRRRRQPGGPSRPRGSNPRHDGL